MNNGSDISCPRAKTDMTPCIARDGDTALADDRACVGCGTSPTYLLTQLALRYEPARLVLADGPLDPDGVANNLKKLVTEYVSGQV
jgi:hypothetical protein